MQYTVVPNRRIIKFPLRLRFNHCVKSVRIQSFSGPYFPAFGLNTRKYGPENTPNTYIFYAANVTENVKS